MAKHFDSNPTHVIGERRADDVPTERHVTPGRAGHEATSDLERNHVRLLHDDVHVLVDQRPVLQVEQDRGVAVDGGAFGLVGEREREI